MKPVVTVAVVMVAAEEAAVVVAVAVIAMRRGIVQIARIRVNQASRVNNASVLMQKARPSHQRQPMSP
jgi:hypothetical protein